MNSFVIPDVDDVQEFVVVHLASGLDVRIPVGRRHIENHRNLQPDKVKDYGHYALECGLTFRFFLSLMKTPDRKPILAVFKMMMVQLKARNPKAKYPLEILRMLVQQYSLMPLRQACQVLYACFVNTKGKFDSHVPADLQMEWIIKEEKKQIKHMYSNKTVSNIEARSSALPGLSSIAKNFDKTASTVVRAKKHQRKDASQDELSMMDDLRRLRPFCHQEGRRHHEFPNVPKSQVKNFDGMKFNSWFEKHKNGFIP